MELELGKLKKMAAITALNSMMAKSYFSICAVRDVGEMLNIPVNHSEAYSVLSTLHCVHFKDMPSGIRDAIPLLIKDCLSGSELNFALVEDEPVCDIPVDFPEPKQNPIKKFLGFLRI